MPELTDAVTGKVRISFANIWTPRAGEDDDGNAQEPKYSALFLVPKTDTATVQRLLAAEAAAKEKDKDRWGGKIPLNLRRPLRDGDTERDITEQPEYAGHWFFNSSSKFKPGVVDEQTNPILDHSRVYSGCYVRVAVNAYGYKNKGNVGVSFGLGPIQFVADGEPLGGVGLRAEDVFQPLGPEYNEPAGSDLL